MSDEKPVPETLETIAASIRDFRTSMDSRFAAVEYRFDAVDQRFDAIDQRFAGIDRRFAGIDQRFDAVDQRFDAVDQRFAGIDQRFDAVDQRFDAVDQRFDEVKAQLRTEIEFVRGDVRLVAEAVAAQTTILQRQEQTSRRFEERLVGHDTRILALERGKTGA